MTCHERDVIFEPPRNCDECSVLERTEAAKQRKQQLRKILHVKLQSPIACWNFVLLLAVQCLTLSGMMNLLDVIKTSSVAEIIPRGVRVKLVIFHNHPPGSA